MTMETSSIVFSVEVYKIKDKCIKQFEVIEEESISRCISMESDYW